MMRQHCSTWTRIEATVDTDGGQHFVIYLAGAPVEELYAARMIEMPTVTNIPPLIVSRVGVPHLTDPELRVTFPANGQLTVLDAANQLNLLHQQALGFHAVGAPRSVDLWCNRGAVPTHLGYVAHTADDPKHMEFFIQAFRGWVEDCKRDPAQGRDDAMHVCSSSTTVSQKLLLSRCSQEPVLRIQEK